MCLPICNIGIYYTRQNTIHKLFIKICLNSFLNVDFSTETILNKCVVWTRINH